VTSRLPFALRALRHRNYRLFFSGQLISVTGTWMQTVAQSWLVYRLTGSAVLLGIVGFAGQFPIFVLASIGGAAADRYSRYKILIATQAASMLLALALAGLTLTGTITVPLLITLAALLGVVNAFDIPARQAFVVEMVGREDLVNAIALNSSVFNGARIVGPAIAGVLVGVIGEGWCFFANGVSYIAVLSGLFLMTLPPARRVAVEGSALSRIAEGFGYVGRTRPVLALLLLLGLISLVAMPYAVLMPIFADEILDGGPRGLGLLMGASGVGALMGALTLAARRGVRGLGRWVAMGAAGLGIGLVLFSYSQTFWLSVAILIPMGYCMIVTMASSNTLIQSMVPDAVRGRVMAVYSMMFMGMAPLGALAAGTLGERIGAPWTVRLGGVLCVLAAGGFALRLPSLRGEARELIVASQMAGGTPPEEMTANTGTVSGTP
jgi:MFS family permease